MIGPAIPITIRPEDARDGDAIRAVIETAFRDVERSDGSEPRIVDALREAGDLALSLVAEDGERIIGHVAISPVTIADGATGWFGLAPVSVLPDHQRQGIGAALVKRAIADMRQRGAAGMVVLGEPDYYARFGFEQRAQLSYPGAPAPYFQALAFDGTWPAGEVRYAPAFGS